MLHVDKVRKGRILSTRWALFWHARWHFKREEKAVCPAQLFFYMHLHVGLTGGYDEIIVSRGFFFPLASDPTKWLTEMAHLNRNIKLF